MRAGSPAGSYIRVASTSSMTSGWGGVGGGRLSGTLIFPLLDGNFCNHSSGLLSLFFALIQISRML